MASNVGVARRQFVRTAFALMPGQGAVVAAGSLKEAVITAIYLKVNAEVQRQAMTMRAGVDAL